MATITGTLKASASGLFSQSINEPIFSITVPGTAAELEAGAATLKLPGEDASKGILLSASESKSVWLEKLGVSVEVDVKD